jgi:hypothetical protein
MYLGESNPVANYEVYKRFILPPEYARFDGTKVIDFARFEAIVDIKNRLPALAKSQQLMGSIRWILTEVQKANHSQ